MYGIKTPQGWLHETTGPCATFFRKDERPNYPFRSKSGAEQIAQDWVRGPFEVVKKPY